MPAEVLVVKRSRRSLFAVPRAFPGWLRAAWVAIMGHRAPGTRARQTGLQEISLGRSAPTSLAPILQRDEHGAHRCVGCDLCVRVCPSRCLDVESEGEGAEIDVGRFELERDRCIGCGWCENACPENAIVMAAGPLVELTRRPGRAEIVDLLCVSVNRA